MLTVSTRDSMVKTVKSIQKAFTIAEILASSSQGMGVHKLAAKSHLPPPTVYRILRTLLEAGYVKQNSLTERYSLTMKVFKLGSQVFSNVDLRTCAIPVLKELAKLTGETSSLNVLDGQEGLCIELVESQKRHHVCSHLGERIPLHCTAAGKILLAFGTIDIKDLKLERYTSNTITEHQVFQKHLEKVRENGIATDLEEFEIDTRCIAAPVRNHKGDAIAAVSISSPRMRLTDKRLKEVAMEVLAAGDDISMALGFTLGSAR